MNKRLLSALFAGAVVVLGVCTLVLAIHAAAGLLLAAIKTLSVWS